MSNDKNMLKEIKNDAVFLTIEYRNSAGMRDELVQISEEHYDWLMEVAASYPCKECRGLGEVFGGTNSVGDSLSDLCTPCKGSGKKYRG